MVWNDDIDHKHSKTKFEMLLKVTPCANVLIVVYIPLIEKVGFEPPPASPIKKQVESTLKQCPRNHYSHASPAWNHSMLQISRKWRRP